MAATRKPAARRLPETDLVGSDPDDLTPLQTVAREVLTARGDLLPSVERIAGAGLSETEAVDALTLFRDALGSPGDPNRDPRVAIANAAGTAR
jgi:hypothetical protein